MCPPVDLREAALEQEDDLQLREVLESEEEEYEEWDGRGVRPAFVDPGWDKPDLWWNGGVEW